MKKMIWMTVVLCMFIVIVQEGITQVAVSSSVVEAKDFSNLLGMDGFSGTLLNNHFKLYQGYVKNTNAILEKLSVLLADKKDKTPEYAELKRRLGWEFNGMLLHEYYFGNLGGTGMLDENSVLYKKIADNFGSFDLWKQDFTSTAAMRGIGWVILYQEPQTEKLVNVWINEHDTGHITAAKPLLVIDVFEHAYISDYQLDRGEYINSFFKKINWEMVQERFDKLDDETAVPISPIEDLMREHGVLNRILLIYEEVIRRLDNNVTFPAEPLSRATDIIRNFIQNYHERLEEKYLFSRFRKLNKQVELVKVLDRQHEAGRKIVDDIMVYEKLQNAGDNKKLAESMKSFIKMYRPHKAREDTILFPELHSIISVEEYKKLGEEFEEEEERLFGENGFEKIVNQIEDIEKSLGINELVQFIPDKYKNLPTWEERKR